MGWLDIVLLIIFIYHLVSGYLRGLVKQVFDLLGIIIVLLLSLWGSRSFSYVIEDFIKPEEIIPHHDVMVKIGIDVAFEQAPQLIAGVLTFLVLFIILSIVFKLFSSGFRQINRVPVIGLFNRIWGSILGAVLGLTIIYIIIAALSLIPLQYFVDSLNNSEVVFVADHYITPYADKLKDQVIDFYINLNG